MEKTYCDFMDEISTDELYEGLLGYGLFTEKLPPVFTAVPFYNYCETLSEPFECGGSDYIVYRTMRNIGTPRFLGIPNPINYQSLCAVLRDSWDEIREHFKNQTSGQGYKVSRIHIRKKRGTKAIFEMNYKNWHLDGNPDLDLLCRDNATSRILVKADISDCFPGIYTHSIPWALCGKIRAKENRNNKSEWHNKIDIKCSKMRNGETHGLHIGPHTSNLISEIILTVVDKRLFDKGYRYIRNIDDYDCYVEDEVTAKRFLCDLEEELQKFDLTQNRKKTMIVKLPIEREKNWKNELRKLKLVTKGEVLDYEQVNMFIDTALKLSKENNDFAIMNYAIKTLKGMKIKENTKIVVWKRVMHIAVLYPYLLHIIEDHVVKPYQIGQNELKDFADRIFNEAIAVNDYESISYAIYFAIKYDFELNQLDKNYANFIKYIEESPDCIMLTMSWVYFMKKNHMNRTATQVKPFNRLAAKLEKENMDKYWLFCYEVLPKSKLLGKWHNLKEASVSFIRDDVWGVQYKGIE